jgi:hypothetical protein
LLLVLAASLGAQISPGETSKNPGGLAPSAGAVATAAGKGVSIARPVPGDLRVIIAGLKRDAIADPVVQVAAHAKSNTETLRFDAVSAVDRNGKTLELRATNGSVKVESRRNDQ